MISYNQQAQLNESNSSGKAVHAAQQHQQERQKISKERIDFQELNWLLNEGETENEILANPYLFEDDV